MPYTRSWNDATPAGTRAANQIDDAIREFKVDLHERMDDALVEDWTTDPVVPKATIGGPATGKIMIVHGSQFRVDNAEPADISGNGFVFASAAPPARCPLVLGVGIVITRLRWLITINSAVTATLELKSQLFTTARTQTTLDTRTHSLATTAVVSSGVISVTTDNTHSYFLEADLPGSSDVILLTIHAVEIQYDRPSAAASL